MAVEVPQKRLRQTEMARKKRKRLYKLEMRALVMALRPEDRKELEQHIKDQRPRRKWIIYGVTVQ